MEDLLSVHVSEVTKSGYDYVKFKRVLKRSKRYLLRVNGEKRWEIMREVLKNPNFDDTDVYYLTMIEIQNPSYKPPSVVPKKPVPHKIRFVMHERQHPIKPVWEEVKGAAKKTEKTRRKGNIDWEFDEEEEKKRSNKKKKVNNLAQKIMPDLPDGFKERIQNLGGTEATLVIQKKLTGTDVSGSHGRVSLPWGELIDKEFLRGKEKSQNTEAMLIAENGMEHETDVRKWNGIYNVVKGWNKVVGDHGLVKDLVVQFWSFRVEGKLWLALVKLWMQLQVVNKQETKLVIDQLGIFVSSTDEFSGK